MNKFKCPYDYHKMDKNMFICIFKIGVTSNVDSFDICFLGYNFLLMQLCVHKCYGLICQLMDILIMIMKPQIKLLKAVLKE